ncbi:hypothetical protein Hypma_012959 [Hypsizygus marmoreus]|uniref:Arrestin-like N-terminal domain-containing protein n=1 Tax=Hypsizygus marmoreus TaxID=39966 RepID=A0A369JFT5_HYPMA|nr:hypothetical protein Hypma_012959 [Hypsizygus marmoreus]
MSYDPPPVYSRTSSPGGSVTPDMLEEDPSPSVPRYSTVFALHGRPTPGSRSARPLETEHTFSLQSGKTAWATLKCVSRAGTSTNAPHYIGGDDISGSVNLDLTNALYINAISLSVRGRIITAVTEDGSFPFLDHSVTLWSKAHGDPRHASYTQNIKHEGKLTPGEYSWPFSVPFPTTVPLPGDTTPHQIPQTFLEREALVTVQYDLILRIGRGALRPDKIITVPIVYIPKIVPEAPSPLRQLAYHEASPLLGPSADPEGWLTLPTVVVHGSPSDGPAKTECKLSIASPLCYARGTVIPCSLTLRSQYPRALDDIAAPEAIIVKLTRRVKHSQLGLLQAVRKPKIQTKVVETAVWWPSSDISTDPSERRMEGEIHLSRRLLSSSDFPPFVVDYFVEFLAFRSGAIPHDPPDAILVAQRVSIATIPARGPRMREFSTRNNT